MKGAKMSQGQETDSGQTKAPRDILSVSCSLGRAIVNDVPCSSSLVVALTGRGLDILERMCRV